MEEVVADSEPSMLQLVDPGDVALDFSNDDDLFLNAPLAPCQDVLSSKLDAAVLANPCMMGCTDPCPLWLTLDAPPTPCASPPGRAIRCSTPLEHIPVPCYYVQVLPTSGERTSVALEVQKQLELRSCHKEHRSGDQEKRLAPCFHVRMRRRTTLHMREWFCLWSLTSRSAHGQLIPISTLAFGVRCSAHAASSLACTVITCLKQSKPSYIICCATMPTKGLGLVPGGTSSAHADGSLVFPGKQVLV